jgi:protein-disulfide isomerase
MKKNPLPFRIPRFNFNTTGINGFLVLSLVIFSFVLGMLTNKVIYLEQQLKNPVAAAPTDAQAAVPTPPAVVENLSFGHLPLLGNKNAKVTVVEFSDFQCPFCKSYFDQTAAQLNDTYIKTGKISFAYRHFPLTSIHPNAQKAAEASECANEQSKFWEYHDKLFAEQDTWSPLAAADAATNFVEYAGALGLDTAQFSSCLESEKFKQKVADDNADSALAQVDATPTFFVNGVRVTGAVPFADLQKVIEEQLKK